MTPATSTFGLERQSRCLCIVFLSSRLSAYTSRSAVTLWLQYRHTLRNPWFAAKPSTHSVVYRVKCFASDMALRVETIMQHIYGPALLSP